MHACCGGHQYTIIGFIGLGIALIGLGGLLSGKMASNTAFILMGVGGLVLMLMLCAYNERNPNQCEGCVDGFLCGCCLANADYV